jgi:PAS domain S-box-containing protein
MAKDPTQPAEGAEFAQRLRERAQRILDLWEQRARQRFAAAGGAPRPVLIDHLPKVLDDLAETLSSPSPRQALAEAEEKLAALHGQERAGLAEYSLDQLVHEYTLLRQVLFEVVEEEGDLPASARDVVLDAIGLGIRNAVREFVRLREAERQRNQEALREANRDLEARIHARTLELGRSEERFRTIVEVVKDYAIFTLDPGGYITSWNTGAERMKGYQADEAIGQHFSMLYPEDGQRRDEPMNHLRVAAAEGRYRGEGLRIRKNGDLYIADVSITPIYEDGQLQGFTKVVQDLTERNLLMQERDLTRAHAAWLEAETEYRKRFVATLTHDLRSPLSAAKSAAQMIARSPSDQDKVLTWAQRIADAVDRTDRMISDLLDASRLEAGGRLALKFERFDLAQMARAFCEELSTRLGDRFVVQGEGDTVGFWSLDGLRRVLDNLLSNAVKYGPPGTPITVRVNRNEPRMLLSVHNHGTLIPVEDQNKLFQPFHRTRLAEASERSGWGLGLTLVKGIVEAHRGMVKVESYPREGTYFTVDLPVDARPAPS